MLFELLKLATLSVALTGSVSTSTTDPYLIQNDINKQSNFQLIVEQSEIIDHDVYEMLAIAETESSFNEKAISSAKSYGLFQINCKAWYKDLKYKNIKQCVIGMMDPLTNMLASLHVLNAYSNLPQCQGKYLYACYNGGMGWMKSVNKSDILKYSNIVEKRKNIIHLIYQTMIDSMRMNFNDKLAILDNI